MTSDGARIAFVVAVAENGVIGKDGDLPWHLPSDLKFFRAVTMNKPVVMGRKTYDSIGKPLDGRDNIVVSRNPDFRPDGVLVARTIEDALNIARTAAHARGADEISIIGGEEIFKVMLPQADVIYLTEVYARAEGDAYFPEIDDADWREISRERHEAGPNDSADYSFVVLERKE